jgi:ATP-dependent protease ClpP protease subunit
MQIFTVGVGVAYGQCAMLLSAGSRGKRFMLPHATALLQQPRVPPTGARQAIEVQIRWREAFAQYQNHLQVLSETTGHSVEKLDYDLQRYEWPHISALMRAAFVPADLHNTSQRAM